MTCRYVSVVVGVVLFISTFAVQAASREDQEAFAISMVAKMNNNQAEDAKIAILEYLNTEPDAGPVIRSLAHYYMKTRGEREDSLVGFRYPDSAARNIVELLNKSIDINADDHEAWSLLLYTHAVQGDIPLAKRALAAALEIDEKAQWLEYNAALLAVRENNLSAAVRVLVPLTVNRQIRQGPDTSRILRNSWILLRNIGLQNPSLDSLDTISEGLATRVDLNELPEFLYEYDQDDKPLMLLWSSQDSGCGPCVDDLADFKEIAQYNKANGSAFNIVYTSTEPWSDVSYYSRILRSMGMHGAPTYRIINDRMFIHTVINHDSQVNILKDFIDDPEKMLKSARPTVMVLPRKDYLFDQINDEFEKLDFAYVSDFSATAYLIDGSRWHLEKVREQDSQQDADEQALSACANSVSSFAMVGECLLYSQGDEVVDGFALVRMREREEQGQLLSKSR